MDEVNLCKLNSVSCVHTKSLQLCLTLAMPSPPGDLPDPGIKATSLISPALAGRFFTTSTTWEALNSVVCFFQSSAYSERVTGKKFQAQKPRQKDWHLGMGREAGLEKSGIITEFVLCGGTIEEHSHKTKSSVDIVLFSGYSLWNNLPKFGILSPLWFLHPWSRNQSLTFPASLAIQGRHVTRASPIRCSDMRLWFAKEKWLDEASAPGNSLSQENYSRGCSREGQAGLGGWGSPSQGALWAKMSMLRGSGNRKLHWSWQVGAFGHCSWILLPPQTWSSDSLIGRGVIWEVKHL